jgi:hypothetical protein
MCLVDVTDLHNRIKDNYHTLVAQAPNDWKTDGFLENNIPISIASCYGQNQPILHQPNSAAEANTWLRDRDYLHNICYVSIALASHMRYHLSFTISPQLSSYLTFLSQC